MAFTPKQCTMELPSMKFNHSHFILSVQVTLTARDVPATSTVWPLNYTKLHEMARVNDYIYVSRYLITGADAASLYLKVCCDSPAELKA